MHESSKLLEAPASEETDDFMGKIESGQHNLDTRHASVIDSAENPIEVHRSKFDFVFQPVNQSI